MGARSEALSTLLQLQKSYPKSKWVEDGKTLEVEIRQSAGQQIEPEHVDDEDVKLMAINGLMNSDPERAIPAGDGLIVSPADGKVTCVESTQLNGAPCTRIRAPRFSTAQHTRSGANE